MDFSGYQQQQQQQDAYDYSYDPSQIQPYHQSSQPYYAYYSQYNQQNAYFPSHPHTISNTQQPHQIQFQHEPTSVHPPGVPIAPEPAHALGPGSTQMQNQYLYPTGPSQYRGRGGRGGRSFRGGGQGQFNYQGPGPSHERGRGRHFPSHASGPVISNVPNAPAAGATLVVKPSSSVSGQIPLPKPAQVAAVPWQPPPPPPKEWCEICKVECNTTEILEQHKNGKRHKKNLQVHEELQRRKAINGQQTGQITTAQPERVQEDSEKKGFPAENMGSEATTVNHKDEIELQNNVGKTSEVPAEEPEGKPRDNSAVRGRGFKRKMRGGRGCKYTRTNDGSRRPVEPPKPKQAISFICELCNVKCESQVVYDSHLTGKKHLSSLKRVHGQQPLNGAGLQAFYPPDINTLSNSINSLVQQGVADPQVLLAQLLMTVLSQAQVPAIAPPSGTVATQLPASTSVAGSGYDPPYQNVSQTQVSEITAHVEIKNPTGETKHQLSSVPLELYTPAGSCISTQTAAGSSETKE